MLFASNLFIQCRVLALLPQGTTLQTIRHARNSYNLLPHQCSNDDANDCLTHVFASRPITDFLLISTCMNFFHLLPFTLPFGYILQSSDLESEPGFIVHYLTVLLGMSSRVLRTWKHANFVALCPWFCDVLHYDFPSHCITWRKSWVHSLTFGLIGIRPLPL